MLSGIRNRIAETFSRKSVDAGGAAATPKGADAGVTGGALGGLHCKGALPPDAVASRTVDGRAPTKSELHAISRLEQLAAKRGVRSEPVVAKSLAQFDKAVAAGSVDKKHVSSVEKVIGRAATIKRLDQLAANRGVGTDPLVVGALKSLRDSVGLTNFSEVEAEVNEAIAEAAKVRNSAPRELYQSMTQGMTDKQVEQLRATLHFEGETGAFLTPQSQLRPTEGGTSDICHLAQARLVHAGRLGFLPPEKEAIDRSTARHIIKHLDMRNKEALEKNELHQLRSFSSFNPQSSLVDKGILTQAFDDAVAEYLGYGGDPAMVSTKEAEFRARVLEQATTHDSHLDDYVRHSSSNDLDLLRSTASTARFAEVYSKYRGGVDSARSSLLKEQMDIQVTQRVRGQIEEARIVVLARLSGDKGASASDPLVNRLADFFMERKEGAFTMESSSRRLELNKPDFFTGVGQVLGSDMRKLNQERLREEHTFAVDETHYQLAMDQLLTHNRDRLADAVLVPQRNLSTKLPTLATPST